MQFLTEVLWVFVLASFLGWFVQFVVKSIKNRKLCNPGFLTLPFIPTVGFGFVLLYVFVIHFDNIYMLFFTSSILLTFYKYFIARISDRSYGFKWKDFSTGAGKVFMINSYVNILEPLIYGLVGVIAVKGLFVPIPTLVSSIPFLFAILIPAIITAVIIFDTIVSCITVVRLKKNLKEMDNISKLLEAGDSDISDEELRAQYERKMVSSKRFRLRLVRAFPDMESFDYEKQFENIKEYHDLVKEKNKEAYEKKIENVEDRPFAYGLSFAKLFWLFFIGSFCGTILETIWAFVTNGFFEMRVGMVMGPFIPVYGGGAVAITLCLYKLHRRNNIIVFAASGLIGATFEYYCSYFQEMFLGTISWDYSDTPFNIDGRTNLSFGIIWGFLGLMWLRYLYPFISRSIEKIPKKPGRIITFILVVFMIINGVLSVVAVDRKNKRAEHIPPKTVIGQFCDTVFNDDYMNFIFPHMGTHETFEAGRKEEAKQAAKEAKQAENRAANVPKSAK